MQHRRRTGRLAAAGTTVAGLAAAAVAATALAGGEPGDRVVASGLSDPRGIALGPDGTILVAETGGGQEAAPGAVTALSARRWHDGGKRPHHSLGGDQYGGEHRRKGGGHEGPGSHSRSVSVPGAVDVVVGKLGQAFVVTGAASPPAEAPAGGSTAPAPATPAPATPAPATPAPAPGTTPAPVASRAASVLRLLPNGRTTLLADIGAYQKTDPDPYDGEGNPTESNPNGAALLHDGSLLVVDAANNDLLKVTPSGVVSTVARFKPEPVTVPADIPNGPKAGTVIPAESVPTSVAVGPDGAYYVSELKGFPFAPGSSRVWRVAPGVIGALCDPASTATVESGAACATFQGGLTSVIDLAWGRNHALYVLEIARQGVGALESGGDPTGALLQVRDGKASELAPGALIAPGGIAIDRHYRLFVTTGTVLGPGAGAVVSLQG